MIGLSDHSRVRRRKWEERPLAFSKWLSFGVGAVCTLLIAVLLIDDSAPSLPGVTNPHLAAWLTAIVVGPLLGALHWLAMSRRRRNGDYAGDQASRRASCVDQGCRHAIWAAPRGRWVRSAAPSECHHRHGGAPVRPR